MADLFARLNMSGRRASGTDASMKGKEEVIRMATISNIKSRVADMSHYYGRVIESSDDLKTNVCMVEESPGCLEASALARIHPDVLSRSYGCGILYPPAMEGLCVLDIGCGAGRDAFVLSQLVGESGQVIGIDASEEQITFARSMTEWHMDTFGHDRSNVEFKIGIMESLNQSGLQDASVDVVVSNCVINLSAAKDKVFREILRVLKPGGELYFSDIFSDRRLDPLLRDDPVLVAECIGDVMYTGDFHTMMRDLGVREVRRVRAQEKIVRNQSFRKAIGNVRLESSLYRVFKLALDDKCEDYGQAAMYLGTITGHEQAFVLDDGHVFETGRSKLVCRNTARMLSDTRYARHFCVLGDGSRHFGRFQQCGDQTVETDLPSVQGRASSCCD